MLIVMTNQPYKRQLKSKSGEKRCGKFQQIPDLEFQETEDCCKVLKNFLSFQILF